MARGTTTPARVRVAREWRRKRATRGSGRSQAAPIPRPTPYRYTQASAGCRKPRPPMHCHALPCSGQPPSQPPSQPLPTHCCGMPGALGLPLRTVLVSACPPKAPRLRSAVLPIIPLLPRCGQAPAPTHEGRLHEAQEGDGGQQAHHAVAQLLLVHGQVVVHLVQVARQAVQDPAEKNRQECEDAQPVCARACILRTQAVGARSGELGARPRPPWSRFVTGGSGVWVL